MTDPKPEQRGRGAFYVVCVLGVLVLYVLSIGPVARLYDGGQPPEFIVNGVAVAYSPLVWAAEQSPLFQEWLYWWVDLWA